MKNIDAKTKTIFFLPILLLSCFFAFTLAKATYYINYWPTDSWHLYIPAAKASANLPFISSIHDHNRFHSLHGKETLVLGIKYMQKILNDYDSLFPNILLLIVSVALSSILIYLITQRWLDPPTAFITTLTFLFCFWPYQYILQGAHQPLVLVCFLLACYCLIGIPHTLSAYFTSGLFIGFMLFASPTSPIYMPYYLLALALRIESSKKKWNLKQWGPNVLLLGLGILAITFLMTFPHPIKNIKDYFLFVQDSQIKNNFANPQFDFGADVPTFSIRGAGWQWIFKYVYLIMPVLFTFYILCLGYLIKLSLKSPKILILVAIGLSTPVAVEVAKVAQFGRNYFSWLIGILIVIAYALFHFKQDIYPKLSQRTQKLSLGLLLIFLAGHIYFNAHLFLTDVFPSRMANNRIYNWMIENNVTSMTTFKNHPYNVNLVDQINHPKYSKSVSFQTMEKISDIRDGFIFIAPSTGKSIWVNCQLPYFLGDIDLFQLMNSGNLSRFVVAQFQTLSSSYIWPQEEEYCSYLDLHRSEITPADRKQGFAYILDARKLQAEWFSQRHE